MPVRQDERANVLPVLFKICEVGGDDIDAKQLGFREHHARIDHDDVVAIANCHGVHPELAETTKGDDLQPAVCHEYLRVAMCVAALGRGGPVDSSEAFKLKVIAGLCWKAQRAGLYVCTAIATGCAIVLFLLPKGRPRFFIGGTDTERAPILP